ncbi:oxidoreductase [Dictyobacter alpinus]|uniref:Probable oxidoreductase n=1 Tax=Dictyobacter alpinus TaxID=2014873 RepID=A0A402B113_9CHLR|nr:SDR family NAD(P)-dependent oxidoreductase [Dictyobacter alpinus]GCE25041.1 oxidoreductase [Dictyobacter alpinus]
MELIKTPFGFGSTAEEIVQNVDMTNKRVIITGASSGIGIETAHALASSGADVTLAVRDTGAGERIANDISAATGNTLIHVAALDLSNLDSVAAFVKGWHGPLHVLVNNAGIMAVPQLELTSDGHEMQFATNFLGHFALTVGLHEALVSASGARIVSVSSNAHQFSPVIFDDVDYQIRPYDPWSAYGQSKTACILLAVEATRRWSHEGIYANALNPGAIATNLQKYTGGLKTPVEKRKTPAQGAATSVLLAASPLLEGIGGRYFEDCNESPVLRDRPVMFGGGVAPWALDPNNAEHLWEISLGMLEAKKA